MHEIICPHCGKAFKIDEAGYADILKQVRNSEFKQQLYEQLELAVHHFQILATSAFAALTIPITTAARGGSVLQRLSAAVTSALVRSEGERPISSIR